MFVCVIAVWGESYTRLFLDIALPAQLAAGNLGALKDSNAVFQIYTTVEDASVIQQSVVFKQLEQIMPVEFHIISISTDNRYVLMSNCHKLAIEYANQRSAALIFLTPDSVIADGGLANVLKLMASGVRVISTVGLRLKQETVIPKLNSFMNSEKTILNIPAPNLMKLALNTLHSITLQHIWNETEKMIPNNLFWKIRNEGLLGRCFHLHPLMVYPKQKMNFLSTIDFDFPLSACPNPNDHYVVTNSDEICICELSSESREMHGQLKNGSIEHLIEFSEHHVNSNHRNNATPHILMHTGTKTKELWDKAAAESDIVMNKVFEGLDRSSCYLLIKHPKLLIMRLIRQAQEAQISNTSRSKIVIILGKFAQAFMKLYSNYLYILVAIARRLIKPFRRQNSG